MPEDPALERLRAAFLDGDARDSAACPPAEEIWAAATGEATPHATRRVVDHLASCAMCGAAWRVARDIGGAPAHPRIATGVPWQRLATYAAALALAVVAAFTFRSAAPVAPTLRAGSSPEIVSALDESVPISRHGLTLRWRGAPAGSLCRVTVADRELEPLYELGGIAGTESPVPSSALAGQAAGALLYWRIACEPTQGAPIASSTFRARLAD